MKKIFTLFTAVFLVSVLFVGCASQENINPTSSNDASVTEATVPTVKATDTQTTPTSTTPAVPESNVITEPSQTQAAVQNPVQPDVTTSQSPASPAASIITKEEAKEISLAHAGLSEADIRNYKSELDRDDGVLEYEIEFDSGKYEYEYDINAETGKIIKAEKDLDD